MLASGLVLLNGNFDMPTLPINALGLPFKGRGVSYGPELHTSANAASDPNGNEADATTGWSIIGGLDSGANIFESQSSVKYIGSYALHSDANDTPSSGAAFYVDLESAPFNVTDGKKYHLEFYARHIGTGGQWRAHLAAGLNGTSHIIINITSAVIVFTKVTYDWTHDSSYRYFNFRENDVLDNGGVYFDSFSVKERL
jgi:hypothetical protein